MNKEFINHYSPLKKKNNFLILPFKFIFRMFGYVLIERYEHSNTILNSWNMNVAYIFTYLRKYLNKEIIIFDVGGHKGEAIFFFKKLFINSKIYSFEPDKEIYKQLEKFINEYKFTNVFLNNYALGKHENKKKFYVSFDSSQSSFIKPNDPNLLKGFSFHNVMTGDEFTALNKVDNIDILKINVQGLELEIIKSFENKIKNNLIKIILVEFSYSNNYKQNKSTIGEFEKFLNKYNYSLFDIALMRRKKVFVDHIKWFIKIKHGYAIFVNKEINNNT